MKTLRLFGLVLACLFTGSAQAQVLIGNGGDVIFCRDDATSAFEGYFFLDYVATWDEVAGRGAFHTAADPVEYIITLLTDRVPGLGLSLREFVDDARRQLQGDSDPTSRFIWIRQSNGISPIHDEELSTLPETFPENCLELGLPRTLNLHQVVIHQRRGDASIYRYDPRIAARITDDPVQTSMLFVHEWLWRFSPNATVTRDVNRYLHTRAVERTDGPSLKRALTNLGLDLTNVPPPFVELRLDTPDVDTIEARSFPFDADYGFDVRITNADEDFYRGQFLPDGAGGMQMFFLRPASLGGPLEINMHLSGPGTITVAHCDRATQTCGRPRNLLEFHAQQ